MDVLVLSDLLKEKTKDITVKLLPTAWLSSSDNSRYVKNFLKKFMLENSSEICRHNSTGLKPDINK
jgi:hypothetical protein